MAADLQPPTRASSVKPGNASSPLAAAPRTSRERTVAWLDTFAAYVRERRYELARALFSHGVFGFGTKAYSVVGLASLEHRQWREIWDNCSGFRFDIGELHVFENGSLICAAVPWSSVGYDAMGAPFLRPGRATIVFTLQGENLLAVHTHFSLAPGVSDKTYPPPPAASEA